MPIASAVRRSAPCDRARAAACCLLLALPSWSSVAHAQESIRPATHQDAIARESAQWWTPALAPAHPAAPVLLPMSGVAVAVAVDAPRQASRAFAEVTRGSERGPLLTALYASFVTLQVADLHSTFRALDRGAYEANPIIAPFADNRPAFVALKLGTAAGAIYMTERLRRHSRLAAILTMVAIDSAYATFVINNYRVAHQLGAR